jgi:hypothetical protein
MDGISPTVQAMLDRTARDWGLQQSTTALDAAALVALPARAPRPAAPPTRRTVELACD